MLVRVYTCQNATLLEITCHGLYGTWSIIDLIHGRHLCNYFKSGPTTQMLCKIFYF